MQPSTDPMYLNRQLAYRSLIRPPETGLAVLTAWLRAYAQVKMRVIILNPDADCDTNIQRAANADWFGMTGLYTNHENCLRMAAAAKKINPNIKTILGGPNSSMLGGIVLQHPYIDYVVGSPSGFDGEEALCALVDGEPESSMPNLWYRQKGKICFTSPRWTDLSQVPLWDFSDFDDAHWRLAEYLANQDADPWQVSPLALFSVRGCVKAMGKKGPCFYCTSADKGHKIRLLPPQNFWQQAVHLNQLYGARVFYIGDDIFTINLRRIEEIAAAKPPSVRLRLRAYGFLPYLVRLDQNQLSRMSRALEKIGVFNLFYGAEHYQQSICVRANTDWIPVEETARVMNYLFEHGGTKSTLAFLLGLFNESPTSLKRNLSALKHLLRLTGEAFERLYISLNIPLRGSEFFDEILASPDVLQDYPKATGKDLKTDDYPDYRLLIKLMLKYFSTTDPDVIIKYMNLMIEEAAQYIPRHRIGGFLLDL